MQSYTEFWTHLFTWNAKADRSQYWIPVIVNYLLGGMILAIIEKKCPVIRLTTSTTGRMKASL